MPSVRINDGDLSSGTGVEGRRKERPDETPGPARREPDPEVKKEEEHPGKLRRGRPLFGDGDDADIFYTKTR